MTRPLPPSAGSPPPPSQYVDRARLVAALLCAAQGLVLVGVAAFYLYELTRGVGDSVARVVVSALLIAGFAAGLLVLARAWRQGAGWPGPPTVVWNVLLLPVAWGMAQGGRGALALGLAVAAVVGIGAALLAGDSGD